MPAQLKRTENLSVAPGVSVSTSNSFSRLDEEEPTPSTSAAAGPTQEELSQHYLLSLRLIDAIANREPMALIERLVVDERVDCWVQDEHSGWTSLHAAAYVDDNVDLLKLLLRKGNAVWNLVDHLGCSAGDIAFSMNHDKSYKFLHEEGVRAEMLRSVLEDAELEQGAEDEEEEKEPAGGEDQEMSNDDNIVKEEEVPGPSTASDLKHYLSQPLTYTVDPNGQPICLDAEGNGVMMGWERELMRETVRHMLTSSEEEPTCWTDRKQLSRREIEEQEAQGEREPLRVLNVGFGLGIIDSFFQEYQPTSHLIIEPHPSVLEFAEKEGWFEKPGVRFFKGTWQDWIARLERGEEEWAEFDAIYFDTYSEHYRDLRSFLSQTPNLLSSSNEQASVSFFNGLGATSRAFYDVYTTVSQLHMQEFGFRTEWHRVDVIWDREQEGGDVWESTGVRDGKQKKKYWEWDKAVGDYRLPICRFDY